MKTTAIKILIVDDDEDEYILIEDLLSEIESVEYDLSWASDYDSALDKIESGNYDVYLFDYLLGEKNGIELLREVVDNGLKAPVIMLTGAGRHEVDIEAMDAGAADFLDKSQIGQFHSVLRKETGSADGYQVKGKIGMPLLERSIRYAIERFKAYEAVKESELKFRAIFDQTFQFTGLLDAGGIVIELNKTALDFYGMGRNDAVGARIWELPFILSDADQAVKTKQAVQSAASGQFVRFEAQRKNREGRIIYIDFSIKPVRDENGAVVLLISEARDITEFKEALSKIKSLQGILPICSFCNKVRDENDNWRPVDTYIHERSEAQVSHSICPDCAREQYPDLDVYKNDPEE
ncbi:diguanylate cyclase/phosphodiesterase (GGDEF & EAL domains) with PAS/PAC sensor(s) [hydrothermal vent metagenome]|uniref:Diguanylate cyclase/phosphodiesterase (GGDEF & EAL domains) with PAS/PAC sensor(S) n=1 Tax=hydrothermal vent metagenome TaxID=652676 RepID=A0A3B1CUW3_9ZZZZ